MSGRKLMTVKVTNGKPRKAMANKIDWHKGMPFAKEKNQRTKNKNSAAFAIGPTQALTPSNEKPRNARTVERGA
jgi:hypothetical protein